MRKKDVLWKYSDYTPTDKDESCWNCSYLEENDGPLFGCKSPEKSGRFSKSIIVLGGCMMKNEVHDILEHGFIGGKTYAISKLKEFSEKYDKTENDVVKMILKKAIEYVEGVKNEYDHECF